MMRLAEIEQHVSSMEELERIVGAMRAIASMRMQEAVRAISSVRAYGDALAQAVREALAIAADEDGPADARRTARSSGPRRAIVLFASEHGFVGGFNERLIEAVELDLASSDTLLVVGSRGAAIAAERGRSIAWTHPMATRLASLPDTVRHLEEALFPRIARGEVARAEVVFGRSTRGGATPIVRLHLFPLELAASSARREAPGGGGRRASGEIARGLPPLHDLPAPELLERLTAEYLLAQLTEAALEGLAAENSARFATLESASDNITHKLGGLRIEAARARQEEVTTELLDLVTGGEALG